MICVCATRSRRAIDVVAAAAAAAKNKYLSENQQQTQNLSETIYFCVRADTANGCRLRSYVELHK